MTQPDANSVRVKKLTKRTIKTDEIYSRRPEVDLQIKKVISDENVFALLENKDKTAEGYLFDETLIYLLREAIGQKDNSTIEVLYLELNNRIWRLLKKFNKNFDNHADFEDFGQKIGLAIFEKIFDINSESADYAQVNFGDFVVTRAKVIWRAGLHKIKKEQEIFYRARNDDDNDTPEFEFASDDITPEKSLILREGISKLPPNIRDVAILILDGWQIESKDENEPTISKLMNVSSRTIRNWLKEGRIILAGYEGEIR